MEGSVTICLDQMGPESAKSFPGPQRMAAREFPHRFHGTNRL